MTTNYCIIVTDTESLRWVPMGWKHVEKNIFYIQTFTCITYPWVLTANYALQPTFYFLHLFSKQRFPVVSFQFSGSIIHRYFLSDDGPESRQFEFCKYHFGFKFIFQILRISFFV